MTVKLLTEHHLEFLSLKGGCKGLFESTLVKMPPCWKSHVAAHLSDNLVSVPSIKALNRKIADRYKCRCMLICDSDLVLSVKRL